MSLSTTTLSSRYVDVRANRAGRPRAFVTGSRVRVQDIAILHERFGESVEEIATAHFPHLSLAQVHGALAYFFEDPEAIWTAIREDRDAALILEKQQTDRVRAEQPALPS